MAEIQQQRKEEFFRPEATRGELQLAQERAEALQLQAALPEEISRESTSDDQVRNQICPQILHDIRQEVFNFQGGRLAQFVEKWTEITQDSEILSTVQGLAIEFEDVHELAKLTEIKQHKLTKSEKEIIDAEIMKLASKNVITQCQPEPQQFVAPIFVRPKKDGTHRMILNLKHLNQNVTYEHFKMETLQTALKLVTPNCYMASIDLKDAYYSIAIKEDHRKYLRFQWEDEL